MQWIRLAGIHLLGDVKVKSLRHPIQPIVLDQHGTARFKKNEIVRFLLDAGPFNLNQIAMMNFSNEDREQLAQLIGYSVCGFGDLSYASDEVYDVAAEQMEKLHSK